MARRDRVGDGEVDRAALDEVDVRGGVARREQHGALRHGPAAHVGRQRVRVRVRMLKEHFGGGLLADEDHTDEERETMDAMCLMLQAASGDELADASSALSLAQFMWILWAQEERRSMWRRLTEPQRQQVTAAMDDFEDTNTMLGAPG